MTIASSTAATSIVIPAFNEAAAVSALVSQLRDAARWHDWGKAHPVFQNAIVPDGRPAEWAE